MNSSVNLDFLPVHPDKPDTVGVLTLNRPQVSNAFNAEMIEEMLAHFEKVRAKGTECRALIIRGAGKHFSGGADLEWMQKSSGLTYEENVAEAKRLSALFKELYELPVPTVAYVHGAAFGGAVGLVACCDWAIAVEDAKFCLSEVRVGLVAAVILPYLAKRMLSGELRRLVHTAMVFDAYAARAAGLVQRVATQSTAEHALREDIAHVLLGEPNIQRIFKANHRRIAEGTSAEWQRDLDIGIETIAKARVSETGQKGIRAFLTKKTPDWLIQLPKDWRLE